MYAVCIGFKIQWLLFLLVLGNRLEFQVPCLVSVQVTSVNFDLV